MYGSLKLPWKIKIEGCIWFKVNRSVYRDGQKKWLWISPLERELVNFKPHPYLCAFWMSLTVDGKDKWAPILVFLVNFSSRLLLHHITGHPSIHFRLCLKHWLLVIVISWITVWIRSYERLFEPYALYLNFYDHIIFLASLMTFHLKLTTIISYSSLTIKQSWFWTKP